VRQNSTFKERVELATDELRQAISSGRLSLSEEALGVLLYQALQRGLLGAVALVVDRGAIGVRPAGRAGVGLHVMDTGSLGWYRFSRRALQRIRHWGGSSTPSAAAAALQRHSSWPRSATAGQAVAATPRVAYLG